MISISIINDTRNQNLTPIFFLIVMVRGSSGNHIIIYNVETSLEP